MSLKKKAVNGFSWTLFEGIFSQSIVLITGIILARLLTPKDFGLIGIITAFISIASAVVEGGLGSALVRKTDSNDKDYNTVFFTNLILSIVFYIILFCTSEYIANFFNEPKLAFLLQVSGTILIISGFSIIQRTLLIKILDFKTQAIVSIISSVLAGFISITMAFLEYGIWSLVILSILKPLISSIILWYKSRWSPKMEFSKNNFLELFNFGYKLLLASLINSIYKNIYYVLIGKYFSTTDLGFYTRADQFQSPFSTNIALGIRRITFPIFSNLQTDKKKLKNVFIRFLRFSVLINFNVMVFISAMAKPIILLLIGAKWFESIFFLQLLCIPGMLYCLQILNLNLLISSGYSNLNLKLEILKKIILLPLIFITVLFSIEIMLYGIILFAILEYFINSYYTNKIIELSITNQLKEIFPFLFISICNFLILFSISFISLNPFTMLIIQFAVGISFLIIVFEFFQIKEYLEIKIIARSYIKKIKYKI